MCKNFIMRQWEPFRHFRFLFIFQMVEQLNLKKHPFVMCNFAPPDMVGHTGIYDAAVKACEATGKLIFTLRFSFL